MNDYKVKFRSDAEIARIAAEFRKSAGVDHQTRFSVADVIHFISERPLKGKGKLHIVYFNRGSRTPYVKFSPNLQLFVNKETLVHANLGDPDSQYILAHEIGHLVLHDHYAQRFSKDPRNQIKAFPNEESAEWQANRFAYYFLLPNKWVQSFRDIETIMLTCGVTRQVAEDRVNELASKKFSEFCSKCFGCSYEYNLGRYKCIDCGEDRWFRTQGQGNLSMSKNEKTSKSVASNASAILRSKTATKAQKSVAASALTQAPDKGKKKK